MSDKYLVDLFSELDLSLLENDYVERDMARAKVVAVKSRRHKKVRRISVVATVAVTAGVFATILIKNSRGRRALTAA